MAPKVVPNLGMQILRESGQKTTGDCRSTHWPTQWRKVPAGEKICILSENSSSNKHFQKAKDRGGRRVGFHRQERTWGPGSKDRNWSVLLRVPLWKIKFLEGSWGFSFFLLKKKMCFFPFWGSSNFEHRMTDLHNFLVVLGKKVRVGAPICS